MIILSFLITAAGIILLTLDRSEEIISLTENRAGKISSLTEEEAAQLTEEVAEIVKERENRVFELKLQAILTRLENAQQDLASTLDDLGLAGTDMAKQYKAEAKEEVIASLRREYYAEATDSETEEAAEKNLGNTKVYPFIVDPEGTVVMHPRLEAGDTSVKDLPFSEQMLSAAEKFFPYEYQGTRKYMFVQKMPAWGWSIGYAVPEGQLLAPAIRVEKSVASFEHELKSAIGSLESNINSSIEVFLQFVVVFIGAIALVSLLVLSILIARLVTRPLGFGIRRLTPASRWSAPPATLIKRATASSSSPPTFSPSTSRCPAWTGSSSSAA
jgi:hypothetical protein